MGHYSSSYEHDEELNRKQRTDNIDNKAVDLLSVAMKAKLKVKSQQGYSGWDDPDQCSILRLTNLLHRAVAEGDVVDIANYAAMIYYRSSSTQSN